MDKTSTLTELQTGYDELLAAVKGLDERAMGKVFYGTWSVKDVLAHIAGWQHQMTGAMERMARGEKPTAEGVDYSDADGWNARFAAAMRTQNATTVVADFQQSFATYKRAAEAIGADRYGEGKTVNRLIETSGYGHYREHLPEIKEFAAKATS
jgi:uncharacterized damage-inducible protein DinB